ncbi:MAG: EF-P beta-lysylation protein EpmB [Cellvibrionales bacterium]|nr:EF-P beta-lysylation protein EpmB [Cellvibrionales bacterium]
MIARSEPIWQSDDWQIELKNSIRTLGDLCQAVDIEIDDLPRALQAEQSFKVMVPRPYLERIEKGNPEDPLLLQVLPSAKEMLEVPGFVKDPLEEAQFTKVPGLIHKYHGRVLLISHAACAVHCRYCFRRHFPYADNALSSQQLTQVVDYIASDASIHEVILSGGDPLMNKDEQLARLVATIEAVPHVETLRIHTRLPIVIPSRISHRLLSLLAQTRLTIVVVIHSNHVNELDDQVAEALYFLRKHSVRLLNQSVLLKGVNSDASHHMKLLKRLHQIDVAPYYLHLLDHTQGVAHFQVDDSQALALYQKLQMQLPGYLMPKLVREKPFDLSKRLLIKA